MAGMTQAEINILVEKYLASSENGYLHWFSYAKHERFYTQYCDLPEVDVVAARAVHGTTRNTSSPVNESGGIAANTPRMIFA